MRRKWKRALSLLCTLAMIAGMLPVSSLAAAGPETAVSGGINGYAATMQADEVTNQQTVWQNAFYLNGERSADLNGKIWTDKSVSIGDNNDFDVTFSALGQTFGGQQAITKDVAFDVMFVLDVSGSMEDNDKDKAAVNAINGAMKAFLEGEGNEENRVGIVTFSEDAITALPLDHYTRSGQDEFFAYYSSGRFGGDYEIHAVSSNNRPIEKTVDFTGGTYTQSGIAQGAENLISGLQDLSNETVHIPVLILITDGDPTYYCSDYDNVLEGYKRGNGSSTDPETHGKYTVQSAAYYKDAIARAFQTKYPSSTDGPRFYTIGQGLDSSFARTLLNPTAAQLRSAWNENRSDARQLARSLFSSEQEIDERYSYADGSYTGEMDEQRLQEIMDEIRNDLGDLGVNTDVGESTGERNRITYFETLGEGVQFTGGMTLTVPKYAIVDNEIVDREPVTYTLTAYKGDTDEVLNPADGPAYLASGGVVTFRDDNHQEELANLSISVRQLSDGMRQMQVDIPPELMAYNVFITKSENDQTVYDYYEATQPLQLTYGVKMRADVETAGSYLVSAPTRSYVHFIPSSAQTGEGIYDMPYYWPGGQFANDPAQVGKDETDGASVAGASDYVTAATKGNNNDVYIYLGNNGLYTLEGKQLTFHLFWDDADNQDGKRPEQITVQLYQEKVNINDTEEPVNVPTSAVPYATLSLTSSNTINGNQSYWEYTTQDLPVYDEENGYYLRYWLKVDPVADYTDALNDSEGHNNGIRIPPQGGSEIWYCFDVEQGLLTDAKLDVKMTHKPETTSYTVQKIWQGEIGTSATMQLSANGTPVDGDPVVMTSDDAKSDDPHTWTHTWENLPKYKSGVEIIYRAAETEVNAPDGTYYQTSYAYDGNTKTTVTNTAQDAETAKMNFTARVFWDDADDVDGVRPESVTLKLVAKVGEELVTSDAVFGADFQRTKEVGPGVDNTWTTVWENLPRFTTGNEQITYSIVEMNGQQEVPVGGQLNNDYKVAAYNNFGDGYMTVTNTHTPATVNITINKAWVDANNQDGIRPDSVTGSLYQAEGGSYVKVQDFVINEGSWSTTINGLPQKAGGQEIDYYVSENAVAGYELTTSGSSVTVDDGKTAYLVSNGSVTLTNTHNPGTVEYTVTLTWDDNDNAAGKRPGSVTVNLGSDYSVTLTVGEGNIGITAVGTRKLPQGAEAVWDTGSNTLKVTGLPQFVDGNQQTYQGSVAGIADYDETITAFGPSNVSYKLSYTGSTSYEDGLGFTKVWENYNYHGYDMRPSTSEYAQYLTLQSKVGDSEWTEMDGTPVITASGDNYVITYTDLTKYSGGQEIQYRVIEDNVPNFTTENSTVALTENNDGQLTNTFTLDPGTEPDDNTYGQITVTKVWNDADAPEGKRPAYESSDPLGIMLYRATDGTHANGIAPNSIVDNGDDTWTYTWDAGTVLKTDKDGSIINYVAYESTFPENYTATTQSANVTKDGSVVSDARIVNAYSGTAATGTLTITKTWAGDGQYTDKRPDSLTFIVKGTFEGSDNATQITRTATMSDPWNAVQVTDLPLTVNGQQVTYTVEESNIPAGYTATYSDNDGMVLANGEDTITVTNTYSPDTWTLTYHANGGANAPVDNNTYSKTNAEATVLGQSDMTYEGYTFLGWANEIHGVVTNAEDVPAVMYQEGGTYTLSGNATLYAVWAVDANGDDTPDYKQKQITVNVVWDDDGNRCGIRPNSIAFTLKGQEYKINLADASGVLITTNNGNTQWIYTVPALFDQSVEFTDSDLTDVTVNHKAHADVNDTDGYNSSVSFENGAYTITLTHTPEPTSHDVTKTWDFSGADFTIGTATIRLLANGQRAVDVTGTEVEDITFNSDGDQDLTWNNLPKYEGGKLITYHAVETQVMNGDVDVTGHFQVTYDWDDENGTTTITNTYSELRNITLLYTWDDDNNATGERPDSVEVELYYTTRQDTRAPVEAVPTGITATISEAGNWSTTWYDLPVYDPETGLLREYEAHVIAYTVDGQEHPVNLDESDSALGYAGYTFDVASFGQDSVFVMNSALDNNTASFTMNKVWQDADNAYNTRPDAILVNLLQNGSVYSTARLDTTLAIWTYTWEKLPELDNNGVKYVYTVAEIPVPGYTASVEGGTITNQLDALDPGDPTQLTVTYVYNNGQANASETVNFGNTANGVADPTWEGHAFKGWYTDNGSFANAYDFTTPVTENITLYAKWVSTHDGVEDLDDHHFITFVYEHASATDANGTAIDTSETKIQVECGSDYVFNAAADSGYILNVPTYNGSATLAANGGNKFTLSNITSDITVTITATRQSTGGGGGGGGGGGNSSSEPELNKEDHIAYVFGYPDGTVKPNNLITRAEVATIFFRLLTDESRADYITEYNPYPDVASDRWSFYAITTLTNGGIMTGRNDGTFDPGAYITRGEFAVVAAQFSDAQYSGPDQFSDISSHWARSYINRAAYEGWTTGYPDGTYGPDQYITRAEVMALLNEVLERSPNAEYMLDDMKVWPDNPETAWFYADVQEATNSHSYEERTEADLDEHWTDITTMRTYDEMVRDAFNAAS